jgi:hypothetical protein
VLQAVLLPLGFWHTVRSVRWYAWFTLAGFLISGPLFIGYANLDVNTAQGAWVLGHFFPLAYVVVAPLAACGLFALMELARSRTPRSWQRQSGPPVAAAVAAAVAIAIGARVVHLWPHLDQRKNHVALQYAHDILATLEPGTVLFAASDESVFPLGYAQAVERRRPDVTVITAGVFRGTSWHIRQLRRRDPSLVIPEGQSFGQVVRATVDANPGRPFAVVGGQMDSSLAGGYWYHRRGLVGQILPMSADVQLAADEAETERLFQLYHIPDASRIKTGTYEGRVLREYAAPATFIADEYRRNGFATEAAAWYRRALAIDPSFSEAVEALRALGAK